MHNPAPSSQTPGLLWLLAAIVVLALCVSGYAPYDRGTWVLEVLPVLIVLPLLAWTRHSYRLTTMLYLLITAHALVLILGGAYTYARVPLGDWVQQTFELSRNPYDKLGHFMQGFVPALAAREILLRGRYVHGRRMLAFLCVCIAMAISAVYELIEWWTALGFGDGAVDFLGTQGDPWDTQEDMLFALIGSSTAMLTLARWHDRQLAALHR